MSLIRTPADRLADELADAPADQRRAVLYAITRERAFGLLVDILGKNSRLAAGEAKIPVEEGRQIIVAAFLAAARDAAAKAER